MNISLVKIVIFFTSSVRNLGIIISNDNKVPCGIENLLKIEKIIVMLIK